MPARSPMSRTEVALYPSSTNASPAVSIRRARVARALGVRRSPDPASTSSTGSATIPSLSPRSIECGTRLRPDSTFHDPVDVRRPARSLASCVRAHDLDLRRQVGWLPAGDERRSREISYRPIELDEELQARHDLPGEHGRLT